MKMNCKIGKKNMEKPQCNCFMVVVFLFGAGRFMYRENQHADCNRKWLVNWLIRYLLSTGVAVILTILATFVQILGTFSCFNLRSS